MGIDDRQTIAIIVLGLIVLFLVVSTERRR